MPRRATWIVLFAAAAGSIGLLWMPCSTAHSWCLPLGVPGEWTWARIPLDAGGPAAALLGWSLAIIALLLYAAVVWIGGHRLAGCSRRETACWLAGLMTAGFFWLSLLQESPPEGYRNSKAIQVLYYPSSSGYFHVARYDVADVPAFLAGYEQRMAEGDVLHIGTHPPGLFLFHRGLILLCRQSPALADFIRSTEPESARAAAALIAGQNRGTATPLLPADEAALWLAALITQAAGVLAVVPLYLLIRRTHGRPASWFAAALWPLVPALALFLPKSDALYPVIGLTFLYCWLEGCHRRSWWRCAVAGLVLWFGMLLSLALLPVELLALLLSLWETRAAGHQTAAMERSRWMQVALSAACGGTAFVAATAALWMACDVNLIAVWRWNIANHAAFYDQFPRTWWKWLLVNPLELALAVGLPIVVLAAAGTIRAFRRAAGQSSRGWRATAARIAGDERWGPFVCCAATFGLLWLSGKNSGETARLWLFLMPWPIWLAAGTFRPFRDQPETNGEPPLSKGALVVLLVQAAVCIATVTRVTGFH